MSEKVLEMLKPFETGDIVGFLVYVDENVQ